MRKISRALVAASLLLAVGSMAACGNKEEPAAPAALVNPASDQQLLAAAAQYKALAEGGFGGGWAAVEGKIASAKATMPPVHGGVEAPVVAALDAQIAALDAASAAKDRAGVALAAAEIYKIILGKVAAPQAVPPAVSLMDYAAIRYDADRRASPPRWDDAAAASAEGRKQWESIARNFGDPNFQSRVGNVYNRMSAAATAKDNGKAAPAVKEMHELVDYLAGTYTPPKS